MTADRKRAPIIAALPKHLRVIAAATRRIGKGRRQTPETIAIEKDEIAVTLTSLAALIEQAELEDHV